jgi:hypothetical protein
LDLEYYVSYVAVHVVALICEISVFLYMQPLEHIAMNLRLYWEAHAVGDDSIGYLLQQCCDLGCELATPPCHILVNEVTDRNRLDSSLCFSASQFSNDLGVGNTRKGKQSVHSFGESFL